MKMLKDEGGFTLIEMMIVLLIISILLLIAIPTMTKSNSVVKEKACQSTIKLLQSQVAAYEMENDGKDPDELSDLDAYVDRTQCPDTALKLVNGKVVKDTTTKVLTNDSPSE